jgi:serine/threonine-protein kinase HipA
VADRPAEVVVQIGGRDVLAGQLWARRRRATESASFSYAPSYLSTPGAYALDPALPLVLGQVQTSVDQAMFGAFTDCAPDRWGRRLITRAEKQRARREGNTERSFGEIDYLLGVSDLLRQGALRFRDPEAGRFLSEETAIPPLADLPSLLKAADAAERDEATESELAALLKGGSSLGGARPKVHVLDRHGRLAIAKFPSPLNDDWDVMRWEAVALQLARDAGIRVADWAIHPIGDHAVLIVDRFDRSNENRIGYVSAMTMLEARDGDQASYIDIAGVIEEHSPNSTADLRELWRRVAFSVLIRNTDDHLRNHGFVRTSSSGWALSPAFDLNPNPRPGPKQLSTAIDDGRFDASLETAMEVAPVFQLSPVDALAVLAEVLAATTRWQKVATQIGVPASQIGDMSTAFEHEDANLARDLVRAPSRT